MKEKKKWTVMIYMSGDNDLSEECVWALKEMCRVGLNSQIAVMAQYDSVVRGVPTSIYDFGKINQSANGKGAGSIVQVDNSQTSDGLPCDARGDNRDGFLEEHAEHIQIKGKGRGGLRIGVGAKGLPVTVEKTASPDEIIRFINKCKKRYPAEHYMVVLSGHGSGAEGNFLLKEDDPPSFLSIRCLGSALDKVKDSLGHKVDIFGLDACSMSTVEVGFELRNAVKYFIGAEGFEMNNGWPYYRILEALNDEPDMTPEELSRTIIEKYIRYYFDFAVAGTSVDQSACDLGASRAVAAAVKQLAGALSAGLADQSIKDAIILAHWRAQSYKFEEYVDLWDFCHLLGNGCDDSSIKTACRNVQEALARRYVLKSCYSGPAFQHSHGASIYFPWAGEVPDSYLDLEFSKKTGWGRFLSKYLVQTRREMRRDKEDAKLIKIPMTETLSSNVRISPQYNNKGEIVKLSRVKNPPWEGFYKDDCE